MFSEKQLIIAKRFLSRAPHFHALGVELLAMDKGYCQMQLEYRQDLVGNPATGVVHGGVMTTLLDSVCGLSVFASLNQMRPVATLDLRIDYLKPATPMRTIIAEARVDKMTRTVAFVSGLAYHSQASGDPIARATASFMVNSVAPNPKLDAQ